MSQNDISSVVLFIIGNEKLKIELEQSVQLSCKQIRIRRLDNYQIIPIELYESLFESLNENKLIPRNPRVMLQTHGLSCLLGKLPSNSGSLCVLVNNTIILDVAMKFLVESVNSNKYIGWKPLVK